MIEKKFRAWINNAMLDWICITQTAFNDVNVLEEYQFLKDEHEQKSKIQQSLDRMLSVGSHIKRGLMYRLFTNPEVILMQYIGLQDKSGRDIYEGDILSLVDKYGQTIKVVCEYGIHRRGIDSGNIVDIPGFSFLLLNGHPTFPIVLNYKSKHDLEIIEIIGNIYENPELIK